MNVRDPSAEAEESFHASNSQNHNYQLIVYEESARVFYLQRDGSFMNIKIRPMFTDDGNLDHIKFRAENFPIPDSIKDQFQGHGVPVD